MRSIRPVHSAGLTAYRPAVRLVAVAASGNLPVQLTSFVGREAAVAELARRLAAPTRLLTLTGAGGVGKTRLALRVAEGVAESFRDGVWLVELAPVHDPALVPHEVAAVLGVDERADQPIGPALVESLRERQLLLVLDNAEHLVAACAELAYALLRACPSLQILATSRQPLGVAGEVLWRVPSLSVPDPERGTDAAALLGSEAAALFLDRARSAAPELAVTPQNAAAVAQLCWRLDGIPLALELAAARVGTLGVQQIAARLDDAFDLLTRGSRDWLPRQQTLRATVDWSHDLLAEPARTLLRRLSVFAGGWTLDAAEAVCADPGDAGGGRIRGEPVLDLLSDLVERSLVLAEGQGDQPRYRLLETIRQYGAQRLQESGEEAAARGLHRAWFLALAERADAELYGAAPATALDRLEREHDNIRAALRWALDEGADAAAAEEGLRLAVACAYFWQIRGHRDRTEARRWLDLALARAPGAPPALRARAFNWAGTMAVGALDRATAARMYRSALTLWRELGYERGIAESLTGLGSAARSRGDYAEAEELLAEGLSIARGLGDNAVAASALRHLAWSAQADGRPEQADALATEALAQFRAAGERHMVGHVLDLIGEIARDLGDCDRAERALHEAKELLEGAGCEEGAALSEVHLAQVAHQRGDRAAAVRRSSDGLRLMHRLGIMRDTALSLEVHAGVIGREHPTRAAQALGAAEALRERLESPMSPAERARHGHEVAAIRGQLGAERFAAARREGRAMPIDDAVAAALSVAPAAEAPRLGPLTQREWEVARLVGEGLGNRDIANRLVISERTAERHLENIRAKLGLNTRTQVAAWTAQRESEV
jgi:predicted ATPase/DNA-binding CsgD family transcriptional regulator